MCRTPTKKQISEEKKLFKRWKKYINKEVRASALYLGESDNLWIKVRHMYVDAAYFRNHQYVRIHKPVKYIPELESGCQIVFKAIVKHYTDIYAEPIDVIRVEFLSLEKILPKNPLG